MIIGIDLGLDGAIATLMKIEGAYSLSVYDMPTFEVRSRTRVKRELDLPALRSLLAPNAHQTRFAVLEIISTRPGYGLRAALTAGYGWGAVEGLLAALNIGVHRVSPVRWKKVMLADMGRDKDASRFKATQVFPNSAELFSRRCDHGRAEAALLALYGSPIYPGSPVPTTCLPTESPMRRGDD